MNRSNALKAFMGVLVCGAFSCAGVPPNDALCEVPTAATLQPGEATGPLMRPGANCLRCHTSGGQAAAKVFSVGGTVYSAPDAFACDGVEGAVVRVKDATGQQVSMVTNQVGNFWSTVPLQPPLQMELEFEGRLRKMPVTAPTGGCALCHSWPNPVSAAGRITAPFID